MPERLVGKSGCRNGYHEYDNKKAKFFFHKDYYREIFGKGKFLFFNLLSSFLEMACLIFSIRLLKKQILWIVAKRAASGALLLNIS